MPLTVKKVAKLSAPGRYGDGHGLYLQVKSGANRSWLLRYERGGRERWMGLGPTHTIDLAEARERARRARQQLLDGIDPLGARAAARATAKLAAAKELTFEEAATQYFEHHEGGWRNAKHRAQFGSSMATYVYPTIGKLSVAAIDTGLVLKCIEPVWHDKTETANRVRRRIESVLDWATVRGYRTGDNPARWKGHLSEALPARARIQKTEHLPALPFAELPEFMTTLVTRAGSAARALEFVILTAARTGEVTGATWDEINLTEKTWTVPANRIKGGREHRVPLSDRVIALLEALPTENGNPYVFIGARRGGLASASMPAVLVRMERIDITVHGFRSTFRDWAAEKTTFANHIVEMALAHAVGNKVEAAYRRGDLFDKRRRLMDDWAKFASTSSPVGDVVALRGRR
jgi:integrase